MIVDAVGVTESELNYTQPLERKRTVPLETLLTVNEDSPLYHEAEKDRPLYNQGWVMVQFLTTSEVYAPRFARSRP